MDSYLEKFIKYEVHLTFKNIEDLNNVKGIGPKIFEKNKNLIRI